MSCKVCGTKSDYKFCSKRCRKEWNRKHKLSAKQRKRLYDDALMKYSGVGFDYKGNSV